MKILKRYFQELSTLAKVQPKQLPELGDALQAIESHLYPFDAVRDAVASVVAPPQLSSDTQTGGETSGPDFASKLSKSLSELLYLAGSSSKTSAEVLAATFETIEENFSRESDILKAFVRRLFECRNLLISFKSTSLREANENIVVDTKILVDIRPVFDLELAQGICAHTFLLRLKVTHRTSGDVESEIYTLNREALDELAQAVARAQAKIELLRQSSLSTNLGMLLEERK